MRLFFGKFGEILYKHVNILWRTQRRLKFKSGSKRVNKCRRLNIDINTGTSNTVPHILNNLFSSVVLVDVLEQEKAVRFGNDVGTVHANNLNVPVFLYSDS
jgi:glutamate formiminotransferase